MKKIHFYLLMMVSILYACEAPLVLERVEFESNKALHRTDVFQAAAENDHAIVVAGAFGTVLVSDNQGTLWKRQQLLGKPTLISVSSCQDQTFVALAIEGDVWLSKDNGLNWTPRKIGSEEIPQGVTCTADNNIWVVGSFGTIIQSNNKGDSWQSHSLDDDLILTSIHFHDEKNATITGEFGTVLTTQDAGKSWQPTTVIHEEFIPLATYFIDRLHGWVVGLGGVIYYTHDGAVSWVKESNTIKAPLYAVTVIDNTAYAVGESGVFIHRPLKPDGSVAVWKPVTFGHDSRVYLRVLQAVGKAGILIGGGAGFLDIVNVDQAVKNWVMHHE
jgi:photosystem II stability/assembly factor-like uncharacterized protein